MADENQYNNAAGTPRAGGPARPRTAAGSGAGASQDTMQFIALANKNRAQGGARKPGIHGDTGPIGGAANPGYRNSSEYQASGTSHGSAPYTEDIPRIDTEYANPGDSTSYTAFQGAPQAERAEYYDFHIPYGGDGSVRNEGDLVKHRHRRGERRRRRIVRTIVIVVVLLLIAIGVSGTLLVRSALSVKDRASEAMTLVTNVKDGVTSGDFTGLPDQAQQLDALCIEIRDEVNSPLWQVASFIPVVGGDVSAARTLVDTLADVSSEALVPMADSLASATPGKLFADGNINVSAVTAVVDALAESADVLDSANERVQAISDPVIPQVAELVDTAKDGFAMLGGAVDASEKLSPVLPAMLGAEGTRNYLIVAENNVEIRANGGFGGSQGVVTVTNGQMTIGDFQPTIQVSEEQGVELTDEEETIFNKMTGNVDTRTGDALMIPDFPRAAYICAQLWETANGQAIDGVIALDPVFLQYLLGVVGGVTMPDGSVADGTNAATVLMHDVYWNYPSEETDAIFASVAGAAFDKILGGLGDADMASLVSTFQRGCSEGRFIVWMGNEAEEDAIKDMGISSALPDANDLTAVPQTGVYLNNVGYSKMDWYLDLDTEMSSGMVHGDGTTSYQMTVTVKNTITADEAANLPSYVGVNQIQEDGSTKLVPLERYIVYLMAPAGGSISDVKVSGDGNMTMKDATYNGLGVTYGMLDLYDQQQCTITYTVTTPAEAGGDLTLRVTPTCQEAREGTLETTLAAN